MKWNCRWRFDFFLLFRFLILWNYSSFWHLSGACLFDSSEEWKRIMALHFRLFRMISFLSCRAGKYHFSMWKKNVCKNKTVEIDARKMARRIVARIGAIFAFLNPVWTVWKNGMKSLTLCSLFNSVKYYFLWYESLWNSLRDIHPKWL